MGLALVIEKENRQSVRPIWRPILFAGSSYWEFDAALGLTLWFRRRRSPRKGKPVELAGSMAARGHVPRMLLTLERERGPRVIADSQSRRVWDRATRGAGLFRDVESLRSELSGVPRRILAGASAGTRSCFHERRSY